MMVFKFFKKNIAKEAIINLQGAIAQLVEHLHGMQGVSGSSPLGSIRILTSYTNKFDQFIIIN